MEECSLLPDHTVDIVIENENNEEKSPQYTRKFTVVKHNESKRNSYDGNDFNVTNSKVTLDCQLSSNNTLNDEPNRVSLDLKDINIHDSEEGSEENDLERDDMFDENCLKLNSYYREGEGQDTITSMSSKPFLRKFEKLKHASNYSSQSSIKSLNQGLSDTGKFLIFCIIIIFSIV